MPRGVRPPPGRNDAIAALAEAGLSRAEIAGKLQIKYYVVASVLRKAGIAARDLRGLAHLGTHDQGRADAMARRYAAGETLRQIGDGYGLTRERVRQILRKRTSIAANEGGAAIVNARRREEKATARDQIYMDRLGCGWDEYKRIRQIGRDQQAKGGTRDRSPMGAFCRQKYNAARRGIGWELTFWQWWSIWQASGRWSQRGRGQGYVMCRRRDEGPYSLGNVFIATAIENTASSKVKKSGLPIGVRAAGRRFAAQRMIGGRIRQLGTFETPQEAFAAYVAAAPGFAHHHPPETGASA